MKALIIGLGISGQAAKQFLEKRGWEVAVCDDRNREEKRPDPCEFDLIVPSPGIPQGHPIYQEARRKMIPIKGELALGLEGRKNPCIGVTGTNGKTTTVKMIEHCLCAAGLFAKALGNVGEPVSTYEGDAILVVEVSSFQLETLDSPVFDVGMYLNATPDHLDRYDSFDDYAKTKARLGACVKNEGVFWMHKSVAPFCDFGSIFEGSNREAARLICEYFGVKDFDEAMQSFYSPPHRIELVAEKKGVRYYNDSKATNVGAVLYAIEQVEGPITLLLGGMDKKLCFSPLQAAAKKLSRVIVFGEAREKIASRLQGWVDLHQVETLEEAQALAAKLCNQGEAILLSPGCASFDAYKNYEERGDHFKRLALKEY